jgi:hypothetical protein
MSLLVKICGLKTPVALDAALGAVPVLGDVFDIVWKANLRNVEIIEEHVLAAPAKGSER